MTEPALSMSTSALWGCGSLLLTGRQQAALKVSDESSHAFQYSEGAPRRGQGIGKAVVADTPM